MAGGAQTSQTRGGRARSSRAFEALFNIGTQIQAQEVDLNTVLTTIVEKAVELLGAELGWLALLDDENHIRARVAHGNRSPAILQMAVPLGKGVGGVALAQHKTIVVDDYSSFAQSTTASVRRAMRDEGITALVSAPMFSENHLVGVLYVANRTAQTFSEDGASLLSALAGQASIAIENSQLLAQLEAKNRFLEDSAAIHERLTAAALSDLGIAGVASDLAALIGRTVVVHQELVPPFTETYGKQPEEYPSDRHAPMTMTAIRAGESELGWIAVQGGEPLTELQQRAIQHGAVVLAVELLRLRSRQQVEWRLGGELLGALINSTGPLDSRLAERAQRFGLDLRRPHRVVALECSREHALDVAEMQERVRRALLEMGLGSAPVLVASTGIEQVVITLPDQPRESLDRLLAEVRGAGPFAIGVSRGLHDLAVAHREAMACVRFARAGGRRTDVVADDLGPMRILFSLEDPTPVRDYVEEQLGTLLDHDGRDGQLFATLRSFLESDGHHPTIAAECHIHKSTVKYRLGRIAQLLDRRLDDPRTRFELRLAVSLDEFLQATHLAS